MRDKRLHRCTNATCRQWTCRVVFCYLLFVSRATKRDVGMQRALRRHATLGPPAEAGPSPRLPLHLFRCACLAWATSGSSTGPPAGAGPSRASPPLGAPAAWVDSGYISEARKPTFHPPPASGLGAGGRANLPRGLRESVSHKGPQATHASHVCPAGAHGGYHVP